MLYMRFLRSCAVSAASARKYSRFSPSWVTASLPRALANSVNCSSEQMRCGSCGVQAAAYQPNCWARCSTVRRSLHCDKSFFSSKRSPRFLAADRLRVNVVVHVFSLLFYILPFSLNVVPLPHKKINPQKLRQPKVEPDSTPLSYHKVE